MEANVRHHAAFALRLEKEHAVSVESEPGWDPELVLTFNSSKIET